MTDDDRAPADLALLGGEVYTVDAAGRWAQAIAVRDGRVVRVGTDEEVRELVGPSTDVVVLPGRTVVPGFQDAHAHPPAGGVERLLCDLTEAYTEDEYRRIIRDYADAHPDEKWILGGGWSMDVFPGGTPAREALDALVGDRPAYLTSRDGHSAWVSSRALELAGIGRETPDPADGRIERRADGGPLGTLQEGAMGLVAGIAPGWDEDLRERGLLEAQRYFHSLGITAWQDAIVGSPYDFHEIYRRLASDGRLTARVVGALWWDRHAGDEQIETFVRLRQGSVGRYRATTVKIMQDGVIENFTAGVLEPYLDARGKPTDNRGLSFVDPAALKAYVTRLDAEGFQVHFHAIGERAVREALDAIEAARRANGMNDLRHHISHIQVIHPADLPRFRELGVVANAQPLWAVNEGQMIHLTIPFLGPERSTWQYPFGSLVRSGAVLAFGSDWSVSSADPLWEIHVAVNRTPPPDYPYGEGGLPEVFLPEERIDLPTAIRAFTMGSAYVNHLDRDTGSIEVGKLADLVVLDRNPFDGPPEEIASTRVAMTFVEGQRVFDRERPSG